MRLAHLSSLPNHQCRLHLCRRLVTIRRSAIQSRTSSRPIRSQDSALRVHPFENRQTRSRRRSLPMIRSIRRLRKSKVASANSERLTAILRSTSDYREIETSYLQARPGPSRILPGKQPESDSSIHALVNLDRSLLIKRSWIERARPLRGGVRRELRQFRLAHPDRAQVAAQAAGFRQLFQSLRQRSVKPRVIATSRLFIPT